MPLTWKLVERATWSYQTNFHVSIILLLPYLWFVNSVQINPHFAHFCTSLFSCKAWTKGTLCVMVFMVWQVDNDQTLYNSYDTILILYWQGSRKVIFDDFPNIKWLMVWYNNLHVYSMWTWILFRYPWIQTIAILWLW